MDSQPDVRAAGLRGPAPLEFAAEPTWGPDGLVAGVVQDDSNGRVLMLGWLDAEALAATLKTGQVHFHSRSRGRLWRKGETSGNVLSLKEIAIDCDGDALLLLCDPAGPTCHLGFDSCFDDGKVVRAFPHRQGLAWLEELWATIADRADRRPDGSYTAALIAGGVNAVGRKVTEEATELLLGARDDLAAQTLGLDRGSTQEALAGEAADLLYHAFVLLAERGMEPRAVIDQLRARHRP